MFIDLIDETERIDAEHQRLVERIIQFSAEFLQLSEECECAITFVDNKRIQDINRDYRKKDAPTDVISFALDDEVEGDVQLLGGQGLPHHLGDIIISTEKAEEQAKEYGHSLERELGFLALHGFLHLNGYDHMNEADEVEMFGLQKEILTAFGLERV